MRRNILAFLIIGFLSPLSFAQDIEKAKLDNYFDALEQNDRFMGSVAVSQNGEIIYTKTIGFLDFENKVKANEDSKYRIGSISKTFTSVLVLKAVEENKLKLDQTIEKFFPTIKNASKITIENLLRHRSGIHNFTNDADYLTWNTQAKTEKEMVEIITNIGSDFEPGTKTEYSNSNYVLLTYILEKTYNTSFAQLLTKYITKPIGLTNTYFGSKIDSKRNEAKSYRYLGDWKVEPETDTSIPLGAGGIVSTPSDLVAFSDALFSGKLLKAESLEQMKTIKDQFGLGLFTMPFSDKIGYGHTGGIDGFGSIFTHFSDGNISYAMTTNGANTNTNDISITVLSAAYNIPFTIPDFKSYEVTAEELEQYVGTYSSTQIPLQITVTKENNSLFAQATGQSPFPLEATEKDKFKFDLAGVVMEFNPAENTMVLKQAGGVYAFTKD